MKIIKFIFIVSALFFAVGALAQSQQIILAEILFKGGQVKIGQVLSGQGYAQEPEKEPEIGASKYWLELISAQGKTLEARKFSFNPPIMALRPPLAGETPAPAVNQEINEYNKVIVLPFYPGVKWLKIYDLNKSLLDQKDIGYLAAKVSGPAAAEVGGAAKTEKSLSLYFWFSLGGLAALFIIMGLIMHRRRKNKPENL